MSETTTSEIQPAPPPPAPGGQEPPMVFFGIGVAINLLLLAAFVVWAVRQGKKRDRPDD